jgi:hypothetical protein
MSGQYRIKDAHRPYLCPRCGKEGFLTVRWVRSSYYPKVASIYVMEVKALEKRLRSDPNNEDLQSRYNSCREHVRGYKYRRMEEINTLDKQSIYRVSSSKRWYTYMGHYDKDVYKKQMANYRNGMRKSRPNGRTWCKLKDSDQLISSAEYTRLQIRRFLTSPEPAKGNPVQLKSPTHH